MQIEVEVKGQRIKRINSPGSVEDTLNYLTCHFTFDGAEWENTVKTAYFQNPASGEKYPKILADDGTCTVPWEALTDKGFVRFSVAGERDGYRITTGIESFYNGETVYGGEPSEPPTPSQYDQMIALAQETKEIAESVREDADAGEFDGEPGKPGDPGKDGVSPSAKVDQTDDGAVITVTDATGTTTAALKNGKDGDPGQNATDEQVQAAVDAYMKEHPIQVDTEDIIKLAIKNEASGAVPIVVTDSADMGVHDLEMRGWTEQAQYEGKNLFDFKALTIPNDRTIIYNPIYLGDGTFTLSTDFKDSSGAFALYILPGNVQEGAGTQNGVDRSASKTVVSSEGYVTVAYRRATDLSNPLESDIMLNSGSTALPYEPYTGRQPSPNPDYPQEIVSAGKYDEGTGKYQYEVKLTGKNLWDTIKGSDSSNWVESTSQSGYSDFAIDVSAGQKVTVSFPEKLPLGKGMYVGIVLTEDGDIDKWMYHSTQEHLIFQQQTVTAVGDKIWIRCINGSVPWFSSKNPYFQIEYGEERTDFQPYKEQTVLLTSDRPLTKWDRLEKRNGQWGWMYKSGSYAMTGEEHFTSSGDTYHGEITSEAWCLVDDMFAKVWIPSDAPGGYCEKLYWSQASWEKDGLVAFTYNMSQIHIRLKNSDIGVTAEDTLPDVASKIKAYVGQQYEEGNPFIFWYETAEETFVPLSESEQEQMNELYTFRPTTMLSNDVGCEMTIKYIADTKAYIDSKIAAIQAAVVNRI